MTRSRRTRSTGLGTAVLAVLLVAGAPGRASAWHRQTVDGDPSIPLEWRRSVISYRVASGRQRDVPDADALEAIRLSFDAWQCVACARMQLTYDPTPVSEGAATADFGDSDGLMTVVFREDAVGDGWPSMVDPEAQAVTTLLYRRSTGEILEADILVNAVTFTVSTVDPPGAVTSDVRNAVTHEVGHLLGFAHSDDPEATMFSAADPSDTSRRDLAQDDVDAICTVYPGTAPRPASCASLPDAGARAPDASRRRRFVGCGCEAASAPSRRRLEWCLGSLLCLLLRMRELARRRADPCVVRTSRSPPPRRSTRRSTTRSTCT